MLVIFKQFIQRTLGLFGYKGLKLNTDPIIDKDETFLRIYGSSKAFTMTSKERMYSLYTAVQYIIKNDIPGDFVECGVWKGGSTMLIALTLSELGVKDRKIYLYDTFEGMTSPTSEDCLVADTKICAFDKWKKQQKPDHNNWCYASLSEVKENMKLTKYPKEYLVFIKGEVEKTIPVSLPINIALLRLDTDWYDSTKHELTHLFPLVNKSGVIIIDDYGRWSGAQKAVDEYFIDKQILLTRIDNSGRIGIK